MEPSGLAINLATLMLSVGVARSTLGAAMDMIRNYLETKEKDLKLELKLTKSKETAEELAKVQGMLGKLGMAFRAVGVGATVMAASVAAAKKSFDWIEGIADKFGKLTDSFRNFRLQMEASGRSSQMAENMEKQAQELSETFNLPLQRARSLVREAAAEMASATEDEIAGVIRQAIGDAQQGMFGGSIEQTLDLAAQLAEGRKVAQQNPMAAEHVEQLEARRRNAQARAALRIFAGKVNPMATEEAHYKFSEKGVEAAKAKAEGYQGSIVRLENAWQKFSEAFLKAVGPRASDIMGMLREATIAILEPLTKMFQKLQTVGEWFAKIYRGPGNELVALIKELGKLIYDVFEALTGKDAWSDIKSFWEKMADMVRYVIGCVKEWVRWLRIGVALLQGDFDKASRIYNNEEKDEEKKKPDYGAGKKPPAPFLGMPGSFTGFKEYQESFFKTAFIQSFNKEEKKPEERTAAAAETIQHILERGGQVEELPMPAEIRLS